MNERNEYQSTAESMKLGIEELLCRSSLGTVLILLHRQIFRATGLLTTFNRGGCPNNFSRTVA